jgi:uncharacterized protein (TIGR03086 family)
MHMHTISDIRPLHRIAVNASVDIVNAVTPGDLDRPTPCAGWNLSDLLTHMTVQHRGFAASARGAGADLAVWQPATVADAVKTDPAGAYASAAADVLDAFSAGNVLDATFALPEFGSDATFPGGMAIGFHFVDYVVHGWDVARTIGIPFQPRADVVAAALPLVLALPEGEFRDMEGAAFGHAITGVDPTSDLDRILLHLGRSPGWTPTTPDASA